VALLTMMLVVNLGYRFKGTMAFLGSMQFQQPVFQGLRDLLPAWLPIPFPADFLLGIDAQFGDGDDGHRLGGSTGASGTTTSSAFW